MKLCSIASGSSGNCTYIGTDQAHVLVDAGVSGKRINEGLAKFDICGSDLSAIFVTHEHIDHVQGLGVMARKYKIPIFATKGTIEGILSSTTKGVNNIDTALLNEIQTDRDFCFQDIVVHPFCISHDAKEPCGYTFSKGNKKIGVATDIGTFDSYIIEKLKNLNAVVLEANHDVRMLEMGPYPYALKQRVLSDSGHLSNENSGILLTKILHSKLKHIVLAHLSHENNMPALAYETVKLEINAAKSEFCADDFTIQVAKRNEASDILYIA
ncbi:MAG: MBL fold metallo-hydrolase [Lachnospiraceae bacterium]